MASPIRAYAALRKGEPLVPFEYDPGPLGDDEVEVRVSSCGICHSDLSMLDNEWGMTQYPLVPGHEVAGTVLAVGGAVRNVAVGDKVGVGWISGSCMGCHECLSGSHNLCATSESTIVGRHGGFADRVRCQAAWAIRIPDALDLDETGPLFCGGITVFEPILRCGVKPTDRVGVIGIGGLGHLAVQFLAKWGCEVTAFSSTAGKEAELRAMGAHTVVNSRDPAALKPLAGKLDFIISTVNVPLDWNAYLGTLAPHGRLHVVGAVLKPMAIPAFSLITGFRSVSGSPVGGPATLATMLEFCARHNITPANEVFPMAEVNKAVDHLRAGKARYRVVLKN